MVYGTNHKPQIIINKNQLKETDSCKYLGYISSKRKSSKKHIIDRETKMKGALGFFLNIVNTLKGIPTKKKKIIAKACIETVGLYGTEIMTNQEKCEKIIEDIEIIQRKFIRSLLKANQNVANEIIMLELGMTSVRSLMDLRLLKFRQRMHQEKDTLNEAIHIENKTRNLPWEKRCKEIMSKYNIEDYKETNNSSEWLKASVKKIKETNIERQKEILKNKITAELYLAITKDRNTEMLPIYLTHNSNMTLGTELIFQMRSGSNFTKHCKYLRHQSTD